MVEKRVATLAADAIKGKELAEKRANDLLKMIEVKVEMAWPTDTDSPQGR